MGNKKFYVCEHCGNLVELILDAGVEMQCCGQSMTELKANTVEASAEKHIPAVEVTNDTITVQIGSIEHPMIENHYIQWIALETSKGIQRKELKYDEEPKAKFVVVDEKPLAVYAYCNIHGLWKKEI